MLSLLQTGTQQDVFARFDSIRNLFSDKEFADQLLVSYLLNHDPETKDRMRMIVKMPCGWIKSTQPWKAPFLKNMQDEGQQWEIRELSYFGLIRYKLKDQNYDALRNFRQYMDERFADREE